MYSEPVTPILPWRCLQDHQDVLSSRLSLDDELVYIQMALLPLVIVLSIGNLDPLGNPPKGWDRNWRSIQETCMCTYNVKLRSLYYVHTAPTKRCPLRCWYIRKLFLSIICFQSLASLLYHQLNPRDVLNPWYRMLLLGLSLSLHPGTIFLRPQVTPQWNAQTRQYSRYYG